MVASFKMAVIKNLTPILFIARSTLLWPPKEFENILLDIRENMVSLILCSVHFGLFFYYYERYFKIKTIYLTYFLARIESFLQFYTIFLYYFTQIYYMFQRQHMRILISNLERAYFDCHFIDNYGFLKVFLGSFILYLVYLYVDFCISSWVVENDFLNYFSYEVPLTGHFIQLFLVCVVLFVYRRTFLNINQRILKIIYCFRSKFTDIKLLILLAKLHFGNVEKVIFLTKIFDFLFLLFANYVFFSCTAVMIVSVQIIFGRITDISNFDFRVLSNLLWISVILIVTSIYIKFWNMLENEVRLIYGTFHYLSELY